MSRRSFETMRFVILAVIAAITLPTLAEAAGSKSGCKTRNSQMYKFCMINARDNKSKKLCKADYKHNKRMCK
jgi:hypothetical protein